MHWRCRTRSGRGNRQSSACSRESRGHTFDHRVLNSRLPRDSVRSPLDRRRAAVVILLSSLEGPAHFDQHRTVAAMRHPGPLPDGGRTERHAGVRLWRSLAGQPTQNLSCRRIVAPGGLRRRQCLCHPERANALGEERYAELVHHETPQDRRSPGCRIGFAQPEKRDSATPITRETAASRPAVAGQLQAASAPAS